MPYRNPGSGIPRKSRSNSLSQYQPDYNYRQTGTKRHEFISEHHTGDLAAGDYVPIEMLAFKRTFDAVTPDTPDDPTEGNNYQTTKVMNGSRIVNYSSKIIIGNNEQATNAAQLKSFYLDIYQVVLSFYDGNTWEDFDAGTTQAALTDFTGSTASINAGEVNWQSPNVTLTANGIKNSKFTQRYLKHIGRVLIPVTDRVILNVNRVPPKARRSNSGMFWGLVFHNSSVLNGGAFDCNIKSEHSFEEIPSDERLPFVY